MKKIAAVLVLALVAMTAVFAITNKSANLSVKLNVESATTVAFTNKELTSNVISADDMFENNEFVVEANKTYTDKIWASYVSTCKSPITIKVEVAQALKNADDTISTTLTGNVEATESGNATTQRHYSLPVTLVIGSDEGKLAGEYVGTLKLTVTAND